MNCAMMNIGETMKKISKIRVKEKPLKWLKIIGIICCIFLGLFLFYSRQIKDLTKLGYSKEASRKILFSFYKDDVLKVGESKTLNAAFLSKDFDEKYFDHYSKIEFVDQEHFILHINQLIEKGYSNRDINLIFAHGDDDSVGRFAQRERVKYIEEFYTIDYAKLDYYDRYLSYSYETGEDEDVSVLFVNLDLDKEDYVDAKLVTDTSSKMLVNKHHYLSENFEPMDLTEIGKEYASNPKLQCSRIALIAYEKMSKAAEQEGYQIVINSAYRSYQDQVDLQELYLKTYGQNYVDKYVAKPGYSEHQTGLAFDIGSRKVNVFANSKEYTWMLENAHKYGFILRFPKKFESITGFRQEPWHYRYVGEEVATYIHEHGISFEEYWALFLDQ